MIKTILFDFDGVILDSMKIKGDGFMELFKEYPKEALTQLETYHYANGGISRFDKIRYFFNTILNSAIKDSDVEALAEKFAHIIAMKLFDKKNLIADTMRFIEINYQKYNLYIVSGAEQNELKTLCRFLEVEKFFLEIYGSPTPKSTLVERILTTYHYEKKETILIGDSINDYKAARDNEIEFFGYNNNELKVFNYIASFKEIQF